MKKIRVLLVEDEAIVREGIAAILAYQEEIEITGQAKDGIEAVELAVKTKPDVILLDLQMPRQDGLTTIPILKEKLPTTHILVLTSFADSDRVYQAIKCGAVGYMLKDATPTQLMQGIREQFPITHLLAGVSHRGIPVALTTTLLSRIPST